MQKDIKRQKNWATGKMEWDMYLDGRYVGTAASKAAAEADLDEMVYEALTHTNACAGWGCVDGCGDCELPTEPVSTGKLLDQAWTLQTRIKNAWAWASYKGRADQSRRLQKALGRAERRTHRRFIAKQVAI